MMCVLVVGETLRFLFIWVAFLDAFSGLLCWFKFW